MFDNMSRRLTRKGIFGVTYLDEIKNIPWHEVIHKPVRTADSVDIGNVEEVGDEFIVVRQQVANARPYYIPKPDIWSYDGSSLGVNVGSDFVGTKFQRETEPTPE